MTFPKHKKPKAPKLTLPKVQVEFNAAIRRRDQWCIMSHSACAGKLEASHFFAVGGNSSLRFYPPNCHTQCTAHHQAEFHNNNPLAYTEWMQANVPQLEWMRVARKREIKYTQDRLKEILALCKSDQLEALALYIEALLGGYNGFQAASCEP